MGKAMETQVGTTQSPAIPGTNTTVPVPIVDPSADLSIVTPHPIHVAGGFNSTGSLITASGVAAVPAAYVRFWSLALSGSVLEPVPPHEDFRGLDAPAPDYPWLDAADILIRLKDLKDLGLSCNLMRAVSAAPLYRGENIVTVLSSCRLSPPVVGRLQQTVRTTATIFQVRGDEAAIQQLISFPTFFRRGSTSAPAEKLLPAGPGAQIQAATKQ